MINEDKLHAKHLRERESIDSEMNLKRELLGSR